MRHVRHIIHALLAAIVRLGSIHEQFSVCFDIRNLDIITPFAFLWKAQFRLLDVYDALQIRPQPRIRIRIRNIGITAFCKFLAT
jgi:hypothetical protein